MYNGEETEFEMHGARRYSVKNFSIHQMYRVK